MSVTAAQGFVASGLHAGIKARRPDMALIATDDRRPVPTVAVFTQNKFVAPPVTLDRHLLAANGGRAAAVIVNSGNANAGTGAPGLADAEAMGAGAADALAIDAADVLVCSTGIIGARLPMDKIATATPKLAAALSAAGHADAARGILTTDHVAKEAVVRGSGFTLGGMAKGCGMIAPNMATMLAFLTTDAAVDRDVMRRALGDASDRTFNTLNVDGATSTNDTAILMASGRRDAADPAEFADAVHRLCEDLTLQMARDAEGMTRMVMLRVTGAASDAEARAAAKAIAENNLVKCSWYGSHPYWGRLLARGVERRLRRHDRVARRRRRGARRRRRRRAHEERARGDRSRPRRRRRNRARDRDRPRPRLHQGKQRHVMISPSDTARILVEALPYIRRFAGKSVLVKLGGAAIDRALDRALAQDVLLLRSVGVRCVLVHGGGPQVDALMKRMGKEPEFRDGLRVTDAETLEIVRMVLTGKINRDLVATINREALDEPVAVGVSGEDAGLLTVTQRDAALGFVGDVAMVRASVLHRLLDEGLAPVVSTIGADDTGQPFNINADEAARAIAVAMGAEKIVYLTAAPGLLADVNDPASLVARLTAAELRERLGHESISAGMIPKLAACADAVEGGVGTAHIIDGRVPHALLIELLTDKGIGTMVKKEADW